MCKYYNIIVTIESIAFSSKEVFVLTRVALEDKKVIVPISFGIIYLLFSIREIF